MRLLGCLALLGESPLHGFGKTLEFKVGVARRLIDECHYNALAVVLGGLDDQLARGTYAQLEMRNDLVQYLQGDAKAQCLSVLKKHTLWEYTSDAPYGPKDKALIVACLDGMNTKGEDDLAMIASLKRSFARDFSDVPSGGDQTTQTFNARDESMYRNFQWLMSRLPANSKVIVRAATTHAAKDLSGVPGQDRMVSLGSYIHREFASRAFALGCSAYSGSYRMARQPVRQLSVAPPLSLEAQVFAKEDADARYFNVDQLRAFGTAPARATGADFKTAKWDQVLDGLVVFRDDHPPDAIR